MGVTFRQGVPFHRVRCMLPGDFISHGTKTTGNLVPRGTILWGVPNHRDTVTLSHIYFRAGQLQNPSHVPQCLMFLAPYFKVELMHRWTRSNLQSNTQKSTHVQLWAS